MKKKRKKKLSKQKGKLISIKEKFYSSKFQDKNALHFIRSSLSLEDTLKLLSSFPLQAKNSILQNPLPNSYEEISKMDSYYRLPSLLHELSWNAITFLSYKDKIYKFIELQDKYEISFLKADYDNASKYLDEIEDKISYSLWGLEQRLLIHEYVSGLEKNKEFLSEINNNEKLWVILVVLAEHLSKKAESKMSVLKYQNYISHFLSEVLENSEAIYDYLNYKINLFDFEDCSYHQTIAYFENRSSIIDRYLAFKKICQFICARKLEEFESEQLLLILKKLVSQIVDPDLIKIAVYIDPTIEFAKDSLTDKFFEISDEYTKGHYETSCKQCEQVLYDHPNSLEFCILYIKSLIYSGRRFEILFDDKDAMIDRVLSGLYAIFMKDESCNFALRDLTKVAYTLSSFQWAFKIYLLVRKETEPNYRNMHKCLSVLLSKTYNVKQATVYREVSDSIVFLDNLEKTYNNKLTITFWQEIELMKLNRVFNELKTETTNLRKRIYEAKMQQYIGEYDKAIDIYDNLINYETLVDVKEMPHLYENIVFNLYNCYISSIRYVDAVVLAVENYIINKNLTLRLDLIKLVSKIESFDDLSIFDEICTSLFFVFADQNVKQIYVAYDTFLTNLGCKRPSDLFERKDKYNDTIFFNFLYYVCTIEVMYKSIFFSGTDDVEDERLLILQHLTINDKQDEKKYTDEINSITKRKTIRKGVQQVGESKIFVDIEGIKKISKASISESFNRYLEFATFSIEDFIMIDPKSTGTIMAWSSSADRHEEPSKDDIVFSSNIKFVLFSEMFYELRDRFITSNEYGFDSYLSVRIRHGTLSGQLRKPFETAQLITEKDKSTDRYYDNEYWDNKLVLFRRDKIEQLHNIFAEFSRNIDEVIRKFKEEWIQIKTEKKETNGFFDFTYTPHELLDLYKDWYAEIREYDAFVNRVLGDLLERTENNLKKFRDHITKDVTSKIITYLDQINADLINLCDGFRSTECSSAIASCRTEIQNELERTSEWFRFSSDKGFDEFNIELAAETSIDMINNICRDDFQPKIDIKRDVKIYGRYFTYFVDLLYILFDNVVKHSGIPISQIDTTLISNVKENTLKIQMVNNFNDNIDVGEKVKIIEEIEKLIRQKSAIEQTSKEGGTGIIKIQKIMQWDLSRKKYIIKPRIKETNQYEIVIETNLEGLIYEDLDH